MAIFDETFFKSMADNLPEGANTIGPILNSLMSRLAGEAGTVAASTFADRWSAIVEDELKKNRSTSAALQADALKFVNIRIDAEKLRTQVTMTEERRRYNEFKKNLEEQQRLLEDDTRMRERLVRENAHLYKNVEEEITKIKKENIDARKKMDRDAESTSKRLGREAGVSEGSPGAITMSGLGEIGSTLKGLFRFLTVANIAMSGFNQILAQPKAEAALFGARNQVFGGAGGSIPSTMFGGLPGGLMGPIEQQQRTAQILTAAPRLISDIGLPFTRLISYMGNFGLSIKDTTDLLVTAQNNLNMSSEDLIDVFTASSGINKKYGLSVYESADLTMKMVGSLRMMGMGTKDAIAIMSSIPDMTKLGKVSPEEMKGYGTAMAGFIGSMSPSTLGGIMMYLKGGGMPTSDQLMRGAKDAPKMIGELYQSVKGNFGSEASNMRLYIAEGFTKGMGISGFQSMKATSVVDEMLKNMKDMSSENIYAALKEQGIIPNERAMEEGMKNLGKMTDNLEKIKNILETAIMPMSNIIGPALSGIAGFLGKLGGLGDILGGTAVGAAAGSAFGPWGTAIGGATGFAGTALNMLERSSTVSNQPSMGAVRHGGGY